MLLVVSRSDVRFGFDHPFFARPKSRAPKNKFAPHPRRPPPPACYILLVFQLNRDFVAHVALLVLKLLIFCCLPMKKHSFQVLFE